MEEKLTLDFAINAGELLLKSGAETYRVKDTIKRISEQANFETTEVFVLPTGIIINAIQVDKHLTAMKQVTNRSINLMQISEVNNLSRKYAAGTITVTEGLKEIKAVLDKSRFSKKSIVLAGALASASATILLGGVWQDFLPAFLASMMVNLIMDLKLSYFFNLYLAAFVAAILSSVFVHAGFGLHVGKIVVGALIPLVPGLALTSSIRDYISSDLLSGTIRLAEALLISATLASGVAAGLTMYARYFKGVLA